MENLEKKMGFQVCHNVVAYVTENQPPPCPAGSIALEQEGRWELLSIVYKIWNNLLVGLLEETSSVRNSINYSFLPVSSVWKQDRKEINYVYFASWNRDIGCEFFTMCQDQPLSKKTQVLRPRLGAKAKIHSENACGWQQQTWLMVELNLHQTPNGLFLQWSSSSACYQQEWQPLQEMEPISTLSQKG